MSLIMSTGVLALNEDAKNAVVLLDDHGDRVIGFIVGYHYGFARVRYFDTGGIEHEEDLGNEDYELLEDWTKE
jgi:hypothetical protein